MLNALANACWRASPVMPPVACPRALPCPLAVDPSACTLLELLPPEEEVEGRGGRGLWEEPDVDGGG